MEVHVHKETPPPPSATVKSVTLVLSEQEAVDLVTLCGKLCGASRGTLRETTDLLYGKLHAAGISVDLSRLGHGRQSVGGLTPLPLVLNTR